MISEVPTGPSGKLALILIAYHDGSDNIASQRFRGLLRYLPREHYTVQVFSGPLQRPEGAPSHEVTYLDAPLLSQAKFGARIAVLGKVFRMVAFQSDLNSDESWIAQVVAAARARVRSELDAGNRVVVMATYSPVDALIAARLIAVEERVPLIQDFRDGLFHESLGREGIFYSTLRRFVEAWAVRPAACITSVTRPLVKYFKTTYPYVTTALLYNGFDSAEFGTSMSDHCNIAKSTAGDPALGHFGRISASEAARFRTFEKLISYLEGGPFNGSLIFYGQLTEMEVGALSRAMLNVEINGQVSRHKSLDAMKSMDALLVITGESEGVATGKIFEYLFSGRRIVLVTLQRNEAARMLEEICDDDLILDFSDPSTIPAIADFERHLRRPFTRNYDRIAKFEKAAQAEELAVILQSAALTQKGAAQ